MLIVIFAIAKQKVQFLVFEMNNPYQKPRGQWDLELAKS